MVGEVRRGRQRNKQGPTSVSQEAEIRTTSLSFLL